ncbi:2'-5' RNA ligase [Crossiella equi]|uniref:RNA 2',3'-cyclic phosphodiesterase n=1 Tax=Crossiella equi TaxID=130796 RepID=A0ABS5AKT3_9PSEU|nr:RNA 2',3'-cyclic phosphodiesterase [Crossiella equi]MBP2477178.1 2'-5' RNA ligase [Crossiella equi]
MTDDLARLFTALWLPADVRDHLADHLAAAGGHAVRGTKPEPVERWHLTLCFHGELPIERQVARLSEVLRGLPAPTLRLRGAGEFHNGPKGVLWAGVEPATPGDGRALHALALAAGADRDRFDPHLTLLRWTGPRPETRSLDTALADYTGPWWTPTELALVRSDRTPSGPHYTSVARLALTC